jgi:hypothetical protein
VAALDVYEAGKARRGPRIRETERGGRRQKRLEREAQEQEQGLSLVSLQRRRGRPQKS